MTGGWDRNVQPHRRVRGVSEGLLLRPAQQGLGAWVSAGGGHSKATKQS